MTSTSELSRDEFCKFLSQILDGSMRVEDWNRCALKKSPDAEVEAARRRLVEFSLECRQCSARPIPTGIEAFASELLEQLSV